MGRYHPSSFLYAVTGWVDDKTSAVLGAGGPPAVLRDVIFALSLKAILSKNLSLGAVDAPREREKTIGFRLLILFQTYLRYA